MAKGKRKMPDIFELEINRTTVERAQNKKRTSLVRLKAEHIEFGVMLRQVKFNMPHGMFQPWVKENLADSLSARTSRRYYQLALRFYRSEAAAEFAALPAEVQQAQLNGESDNSVFLAAVEDFLGMD